VAKIEGGTKQNAAATCRSFELFGIHRRRQESIPEFERTARQPHAIASLPDGLSRFITVFITAETGDCTLVEAVHRVDVNALDTPSRE
jgi:hypothetical protein